MCLPFALSIISTVMLVICCYVINYPQLIVLKPIEFRCGLGAGAKAVGPVLGLRRVC